ncbi:MAG: protein translocase subunit SecF [Parcubacteria group bacterium]|nr:protein translocase subunit SecF [Parcubacteria group bacterium]
MWSILKYKKLYFIFSGVLIAASFFAILAWGLRLGIDFTGGSLLELEFIQTRPDAFALAQSMDSLALGKIEIQGTGEKGYILRMRTLTGEEHQKLTDTLSSVFKLEGAVPKKEPPLIEIKPVGEGAKVEIDPNAVVVEEGASSESKPFIEKRFDSIGPIIGNELKSKTLLALFLAIIGIIIYIAWAFRTVSWPVPSWKYAVVANIALVHNILIVIGVFSFLGMKYGAEINAPFVAALLTILGYTINDTIVVFDRLRENLGKMRADFEIVVNTALNQTLARSMNTGLTTLFTLVAVYLFGGASIRDFALALIIGIAVGTYTSICIASPLLVVWHRRK